MPPTVPAGGYELDALTDREARSLCRWSTASICCSHSKFVLLTKNSRC
jgi:hypothetical protein